MKFLPFPAKIPLHQPQRGMDLNQGFASLFLHFGIETEEHRAVSLGEDVVGPGGHGFHAQRPEIGEAAASKAKDLQED